MIHSDLASQTSRKISTTFTGVITGGLPLCVAFTSLNLQFGTRDLTLDDLVGFCTEEHHLQHLNLVDIATRLNPEVDIAQVFRMSRMPWLSFKYYGDDLNADTFADIIRIASPTVSKSVWVRVCVYVCMHVYVCVCVCVCVCVHAWVDACVCGGVGCADAFGLPVCRPVCLSVSLSVCLYMCLSACLSVLAKV